MPFQIHSKGVTARIRLTPGSRQTACQGLCDIAGNAGGRLLKISVKAIPEDGKANRALLAFLSGEWGVAKSSLSLLSGESSRIKAVLVHADHPVDLFARLQALYR